MLVFQKLKKTFTVLLYLFLVTTIGILVYSDRNFISVPSSNFNGSFSVVNGHFGPDMTSELQFIEKGSQFIRNLPPASFIKGDNKYGPKFFKNSTCARFPNIFNLEFSATIWQVQKQQGWAIYLFGAYWDTRQLKNKKDPAVRVLTLMDRLHSDIKETYCQIWFEDQTQPLIIKVDQYIYLWITKMGNIVNGELQPYLLSCPMPIGYNGKIPISVSIVPSLCTNATNNIRIHVPEKPQKKEPFAVFVKGLSFIDTDWSVRLVEWIEFVKLMGATKIFMYDLQNHPNVNKVFRYYESTKEIEVMPLSHPAGIPNDPYLRHIYFKTGITTVTRARKRMQELIPYNDCLYKNMYNYEYIAVLDTDEVIVPHNDARNWMELVEGLEKTYNNGTSFPYYTFLDVIFSTSDTNESKKEESHIPTYFHMLRHTVRRKIPEKKHLGIKCIYRPEDILILRHHYSECVNNDQCTKIYVDMKDAYLHHYTIDGPELPTNGMKLGKKLKREYQLWNWKDELILNTNKVLLEIGLIS